MLKDVHWIGGSPFNMEVYGFAAWNSDRGVISLRNPDDVPHSFQLEIEKALELTDDAPRKFMMKSPWKEDTGKPSLKAAAGIPVSITLKPFQVMVLDIIPEE